MLPGLRVPFFGGRVKTGTADIVPTMTSNTAPSGTASASSVSGAGGEAWRVFDKSTSNGWVSASPPSVGTPQWVQYQATSAKTVTEYSIIGLNTAIATPNSFIAARTPRDWTFRGSNDGTSWTTIDTQTGHTWTNLQKKNFIISSPGAYSYYRVEITANNGDGSFVHIVDAEYLEDVFS